MQKFWHRYWYPICLFAIIVLASGLRLYKLGIVPHGMTWDEAAIGYNGYAVITQRRDEWLDRLPISFQSFGDYKAPLAIYISGLFTVLLGSELWVVRLPFALSGIAAILGMMLYTEKLFAPVETDNSKHQSYFSPQQIALASGLIMTLSPWHLHYSRIGFESGMSLMWLTWGLYALLCMLKADPDKKGRLTRWSLQHILAFISTILLAASMYTYHSAKLVVPVLGLSMLIWQHQAALKKWRLIVFQALFGALLLVPMATDVIFGAGSERFNQATLFNKGLSTSEILITILKNFGIHFTPNYLLFGETPTLRHGDGNWGILFSTTLLLGLIALGVTVWQRLGVTRAHSQKNYSWISFIGLVWIITGVIPAAIGVDVPHSNRALLALPGFIILAVVGLQVSMSWLKNSTINKDVLGTHNEPDTILRAALGVLIIVHGALFLSYQHHYYTDFASESAEDFKDGYLEAFEYVNEYEHGLNGKKRVDKILFTTDYGQPYIYALFIKRIRPIVYRGGGLNTYLFVDKINIGELSRENTVIVASADDDIPIEQAEKIIYGSDGTVRFKIYVTE